MRLTEAAKPVEYGAAEILTYYAFPSRHWRSLRTNHPLERLMREIRRRTRVIDFFRKLMRRNDVLGADDIYDVGFHLRFHQKTPAHRKNRNIWFLIIRNHKFHVQHYNLTLRRKELKTCDMVALNDSNLICCIRPPFKTSFLPGMFKSYSGSIRSGPIICGGNCGSSSLSFLPK